MDILGSETSNDSAPKLFHGDGPRGPNIFITHGKKGETTEAMAQTAPEVPRGTPG
jgi:hypothetical protein